MHTHLLATIVIALSPVIASFVPDWLVRVAVTDHRHRLVDQG